MAQSKRSMTLMSPAPDKCPVCAVKHSPGFPHDRESLYYQVKFNMEHGRVPTWLDAMAHCTDQVKKIWIEELEKLESRSKNE